MKIEFIWMVTGSGNTDDRPLRRSVQGSVQ